MRVMEALLGAVLALGLGGAHPAAGQAPHGAWLEAPLSNWNTLGMAIPLANAQAPQNPRCMGSVRPPETPVDHLLVERGWLLFGAYQAGWGIDVVHAASGMDGMCRPMQYNVFVFRYGQFMGTISPELMDSRTTGQEAGTTLLGREGEGGIILITARFLRYAPDDPLCCPSLPAITVTYEVQPMPDGWVLVPTAKEPS